MFSLEELQKFAFFRLYIRHRDFVEVAFCTGVDDQNLVRKGVRSLLELSEEIEVIAANRNQFFKAYKNRSDTVENVPEELVEILRPYCMTVEEARAELGL